MRTKLVKRHYCEFCRKGGFFKSRMESHESGCTRNKNRICRVCALGELKQKPLSELLAALDGITESNKVEKLNGLKSLCSNCPACILTAIRHHPLTGYDFQECDEEGRTNIVDVGFEFKTAMKDWWSEFNNTAALRDSHNY